MWLRLLLHRALHIFAYLLASQSRKFPLLQSLPLLPVIKSKKIRKSANESNVMHRIMLVCKCSFGHVCLIDLYVCVCVNICLSGYKIETMSLFVSLLSHLFLVCRKVKLLGSCISFKIFGQVQSHIQKNAMENYTFR